MKEIRKFNNQKFLDDPKSVRDIMTFSSQSYVYLHVSKRELLAEAKIGKIEYYISNSIFVQKRDVMVII